MWVAGACTRGRGRGRTQARARKRRTTSLRSRSLKEGVRGAIDSSFNLVVVTHPIRGRGWRQDVRLKETMALVVMVMLLVTLSIRYQNKNEDRNEG